MAGEGPGAEHRIFATLRSLDLETRTAMSDGLSLGPRTIDIRWRSEYTYVLATIRVDAEALPAVFRRAGGALQSPRQCHISHSNPSLHEVHP